MVGRRLVVFLGGGSKVKKNVISEAWDTVQPVILAALSAAATPPVPEPLDPVGTVIVGVTGEGGSTSTRELDLGGT